MGRGAGGSATGLAARSRRIAVLLISRNLQTVWLPGLTARVRALGSPTCARSGAALDAGERRRSRGVSRAPPRPGRSLRPSHATSSTSSRSVSLKVASASNTPRSRSRAGPEPGLPRSCERRSTSACHRASARRRFDSTPRGDVQQPGQGIRRQLVDAAPRGKEHLGDHIVRARRRPAGAVRTHAPRAHMLRTPPRKACASVHHALKSPATGPELHPGPGRAAEAVQLASFGSWPGHRYGSWRGVAVPGGVLLWLERGWRDEASLSDGRRGRPVGVANSHFVLF